MLDNFVNSAEHHPSFRSLVNRELLGLIQKFSKLNDSCDACTPDSVQVSISPGHTDGCRQNAFAIFDARTPPCRDSGKNFTQCP